MNKKYILSAILAVGAMTGCKDFLTEEPPLSQSTEITLSTLEGLNSSTGGAYSRLASGSWYGGDFYLQNEMKTANGKKYLGTSYDSGRMNPWYNFSYSSSETSSLWGNAYYVISQANNIMDNLEGKGDLQTLNNLKAECLFLRALSYFDLVRTYAQPYSLDKGASLGVPVVLHTVSGEKPPRDIVATVYKRVVDDLTEAERIIGKDYVRTGGTDPRAFASIDAIRALLSRVYLYMEDFANAAKYATLVIDSRNYTLWTKEELKDGACYKADVPKGGEVIFEVYGNDKNSYKPEDGLWHMTVGPYGDAGCAKDIMNLIAENPDDVRNTLFVKDSKGTKEEVWHTAKYAGKMPGSSAVNYTNVIVLRLSEMYLNRAEATVRGSLTQYDAAADLKAITDARGAAEYDNAGIENIYKERQKELNWEGHLWFDLGRTKRSMERTDVSGAPTKIAFPGKEWAMPIPLAEIETGELVQNEGY